VLRFANDLRGRHPAQDALERVDVVVARGQMMRLDSDEAHRGLACRTRPGFARAIMPSEPELPYHRHLTHLSASFIAHRNSCESVERIWARRAMVKIEKHVQ
jgi:hypothetical protein